MNFYYTMALITAILLSSTESTEKYSNDEEFLFKVVASVLWPISVTTIFVDYIK